MLRDLCSYYDLLCARGESDLPPMGYSLVPVTFELVLNEDGTLSEILPYGQQQLVGKKLKLVPRKELFPFRNSISGIAAETIDHREKYLFGLEWDKVHEEFVVSKSSALAFEKCREVNLAFLEPVRTPLAEAYKAFLNKWHPEQETANPVLLQLGKEYAGAKFVITLRGKLDEPLNRQPEVKARWEALLAEAAPKEDDIIGQCAVSGKTGPLARTHDNISGIRGGLATGVNLVCFNNTAFESYGRKQSYNSSISVESMKKYTTALNYLTASALHKQMLGDMTLLFWAGTADDEKPYLDLFGFGILSGGASDENKDEARQMTDEMLQKVYSELAEGRAADVEGIDLQTPFFVLGLKPNSSRLAVKIFEKNSFGKFLKNIARHCADMRLSPSDKPLSLWQIDRELLSPVSSENGDPALQAKLLTAVLQGAPYPETMLTNVVRRCRTDRDDETKSFHSVNKTRARIIRACLRRKNYFQEDEYTMLQENSTDPAYNLGRLFAVLEKVQTEALGSVNATIKDKFFSSACTTPALVFPRLLKLAQPHLEKLGEGNRVYKDRMIGSLLSKLDGAFPTTQNLQQQGMFILGYYQQKQKLYEKTEKGE